MSAMTMSAALVAGTVSIASKYVRLMAVHYTHLTLPTQRQA